MVDLETELFESIKHLNQRNRLLVLREVIIDFYKNDLFTFAKEGLGYDKLSERVHRPICEMLQDQELKRKLIVLPRGCFKSTLCSVAYPIWKLINNPDLRVIIDSELYTNSKRFLDEIKGHMIKSHITWLFGEFRDTERKWAEGEIIIGQRTRNIKEPSIMCSGLESQKTSQHFDLACLDDLSTPSNTQTPEQREKVINHYRYYTSLLDPKQGELIIVGTRYSENDIIGFILQNELEEIERKAIGF